MRSRGAARLEVAAEVLQELDPSLSCVDAWAEMRSRDVLRMRARVVGGWSRLEVSAEILEELGVLDLVLLDLAEHVERLAHQPLRDDREHLRDVIRGLSGCHWGQLLGVIKCGDRTDVIGV